MQVHIYAFAGYTKNCSWQLEAAGDAVRRRTAAASSVDGVDSGDRGFKVDVIFARPVLGRVRGTGPRARGLGGPRRYSHSKPRVSVNVRTAFEPREVSDLQMNARVGCAHRVHRGAR